MAELKDTRWTLRVAEPADRVVRAAATVSQRNLTDFVVGAAVSEAERILGERTRFVLSDEQWDRFVALLDRPPRSPEGLAKLFATPDAFE
ncbi:MAG: DUF1778 domain-containing protein [Solirubrobacteraceae bacterium]